MSLSLYYLSGVSIYFTSASCRATTYGDVLCPSRRSIFALYEGEGAGPAQLDKEAFRVTKYICVCTGWTCDFPVFPDLTLNPVS